MSKERKRGWREKLAQWTDQVVGWVDSLVAPPAEPAPIRVRPSRPNPSRRR